VFSYWALFVNREHFEYMNRQGATVAAVTTADMPNREMRVLQDALEVFTTTTGLGANLVNREPKTPANNYADAVVEIDDQGRHFTFHAEVKNVDRGIVLGTLKERFNALNGPALLIAPHLTPELANQCRRIDLPFIDTAGNAYLRAPGLYVFIKGEKRPEHAGTMGTRGGGTATALRIVFALLCKPDLLNAPYREIVDAAGVALGAVGWVFFDLEGRGYIAGGKRQRNRRLLEPKRLFEEWVTNYPIKLRPKLNPRRFRAQMPIGGKNSRCRGYWGAEVAADRLTNLKLPETFTIYLDQNRAGTILRRLPNMPAYGHPVAKSNAGYVLALRSRPANPDVSANLDLHRSIATLDQRNFELAKLIRERYIGCAAPELTDHSIHARSRC
jgi:hypothetical protein